MYDAFSILKDQNMKKILFTLGAVAYATSLFGADAYMIETVISKNKKVIASPSFIAPFKQAGAVEAKNNGNKYELLMEVDEEKNGIVTLYTNLTLNGKFHKQKAKIPLKEKVNINMDDIQLNVRVIPYK